MLKPNQTVTQCLGCETMEPERDYEGLTECCGARTERVEI